MKSEPPPSIYSQMQRFADITTTSVMYGNIDRAKRCLRTAEKLYNTGGNEIKNAVSTIYLASVSTFMELHSCSIRKMFPKSLLNEYYNQVNATSV